MFGGEVAEIGGPADLGLLDDFLYGDFVKGLERHEPYQGVGNALLEKNRGCVSFAHVALLSEQGRTFRPRLGAFPY